MNLAILFWFYKEPEVCENRLRLLKKTNPGLKIFGLYGGEQKQAKEYEDRLGKYLDDFYAYPGEKSAKWKWINGDLMILDWYEKRGKNLVWDSIVVAQWDMLVFDSFLNILQGIQKGQIFLSGLSPLDKKIEESWYWTKPGGEDRQNYLNFLDYAEKNYGWKERPLCCLFILQVFPKIFFEKYLSVKNREVGMLEYKIPIYAKIFNIPFFEKDIGVEFFGEDKKPLNAKPREIDKDYIAGELHKKGGWRAFHPYYKVWYDK